MFDTYLENIIYLSKIIVFFSIYKYKYKQIFTFRLINIK